MNDLIAQNPTAFILLAWFAISCILLLITVALIKGGKLTDQRDQIIRDGEAHTKEFNEFMNNHKY